MDLIMKESGEELFHAQIHIRNHLFSFINSMSLGCAVRLGIPDIIHNHHQPITLSELVTKLAISKTKTACLFRLMRLLVHSGFFAIEKDGGYVLTSYSMLLIKDSDKSMSPVLRAMLDPIMLKPWNFLTAWFQGDGLNPFETAYGSSFWDHASENNELNISFNEAMASDTRLVMSMVVTECKGVFEGVSSLIDVGGGSGALAKIIADIFPSMKCSVLDLPHVIATLEGSENVKYIAGDMFESIPHADVILLKTILHDWNDEQCIKILKRCKEAISCHEYREANPGKVIIIDMVLEDKKLDQKSIETQLFSDMLMMIYTVGKERTEKEWKKLFLESGFSHYKITPLFALRSLIEVYP